MAATSRRDCTFQACCLCGHSTQSAWTPASDVHGGIAAHPKHAATHALSWGPVPDLPKSSKVSAGVAMLLGKTSGFLHRAGSV